MKNALRTRRKVLAKLLVTARRQAHREVCGLLAGRDGVITHAFAAKNVAKDPKRNYEIAPAEIVRLLRELREKKLGLLGIYHSHPLSENAPSEKDIRLAYYTEAAYVIVNPMPYAAHAIRAFSIRDGCATELEIEIV